MIQDILLALWFLVPAGLANSAPMIAKKIPGIDRLDAPMDGGRKYRGVALLGPHKTWRGLISGMIMSTIIFWLQQLAFEQTAWAANISNGVDYAALPTLILGPLFGLGALGGDAIKSFFKRRRGIQSGDTWIPFDQIDFIIGAIVVSLPFVVLAPAVYAWMFVLYFGLHVSFNYVGYKLGLKDNPL